MENTPGTGSTTLSGYGAEDAVSKAASTAHGAVDKVAASANDAASTASNAVDRATQAAHDTVNKVAGLAAPTAEWLTKQRDNVAATSRNAIADARDYVAVHPWQSMWAALAVGYLVGRRSR